MPPLQKSLALVTLSLVVLFSAIYFSDLMRYLPASISVLVIPRPLVKNHRIGVSYRGSSVDGVEHFQNIFYAEDTAGANRFAPPVPFTPKAGTEVDAKESGAWCPQATGDPPLPFTSPVLNISENCLSLRIARSRNPGTPRWKLLPVLVYLHGGGDALGSAYDQLYKPDGLVKNAKANGQPIIWVNINYRLGVFGYATSKALRSLKHTNVGLRDQRAAFEWVRDNIEAFGGDPNNVVAVGQSVGAMAIGLHLVSFGGSKGVPFQKAIMMSGATGTNFNIQTNMAAEHTTLAARAVGCSGDPDSRAILDCLRNIPFEKLTEASISIARKTRPPFGEMFYSPSLDDDFLTDRPSVLLRKHAFVKGIPIIASWMSNDGAWYAPPMITKDEEVISTFGNYILDLSQPTLDKLLSLYPVADFEHLVRPSEEATAQYYRAAQMNRDIWFTCPALDFTYQYIRGGGTDHVRFYQMNQTKYGPIFQYMGVPQWRVSHLSDIPYMLNADVAAGGDNSEEQRRLSQLLSGSLVAFAWTRDPNVMNKHGREGLRDWPMGFSFRDRLEQNVSPTELDVMVVGGGGGSGAVRVYEEKRKAKSEKEKAFAWEHILQRCKYINSISEELGV